MFFMSTDLKVLDDVYFYIIMIIPIWQMDSISRIGSPTWNSVFNFLLLQSWERFGVCQPLTWTHLECNQLHNRLSHSLKNNLQIVFT